jgi:hypothetical protein
MKKMMKIKSFILDLYESWSNLVWWQKLLLILPFIIIIVLATLLLILSNRDTADKEILKYSKDTVEKYVDSTKEKEKSLAEQQKVIKNKRIITEEKIEENVKKTESIIEEIDNADGDINKLLSIHDRLNARRRNT